MALVTSSHANSQLGSSVFRSSLSGGRRRKIGKPEKHETAELLEVRVPLGDVIGVGVFTAGVGQFPNLQHLLDGSSVSNGMSAQLSPEVPPTQSFAIAETKGAETEAQSVSPSQEPQSAGAAPSVQADSELPSESDNHPGGPIDPLAELSNAIGTPLGSDSSTGAVSPGTGLDVQGAGASPTATASGASNLGDGSGSGGPSSAAQNNGGISPPATTGVAAGSLANTTADHNVEQQITDQPATASGVSGNASDEVVATESDGNEPGSGNGSVNSGSEVENSDAQVPETAVQSVATEDAGPSTDSDASESGETESEETQASDADSPQQSDPISVEADNDTAIMDAESLAVVLNEADYLMLTQSSGSTVSMGQGAAVSPSGDQFEWLTETIRVEPNEEAESAENPPIAHPDASGDEEIDVTLPASDEQATSDFDSQQQDDDDTPDGATESSTEFNGSGVGSGISSGTGTGLGSGTGCGSGTGTGCGTGTGTGFPTGTGTGTGTGSGTGSGTGTGTGIGPGHVCPGPDSNIDAVDDGVGTDNPVFVHPTQPTEIDNLLDNDTEATQFNFCITSQTWTGEDINTATVLNDPPDYHWWWYDQGSYQGHIGPNTTFSITGLTYDREEPQVDGNNSQVHYTDGTATFTFTMPGQTDASWVRTITGVTLVGMIDTVWADSAGGAMRADFGKATAEISGTDNDGEYFTLGYGPFDAFNTGGSWDGYYQTGTASDGFFGAVDDDGDGTPEYESTLYIVSVGDIPSGMQITVGEAGLTVDFDPNGVELSGGNFSYTISDASGDSDTATVSFQTVPVPTVALAGDTHGLETSSPASAADPIHVRFYRNSEDPAQAPNLALSIEVRFQLTWGTVNRRDFDSNTPASILDQLEGSENGGEGRVTIPAGQQFVELLLVPDWEESDPFGQDNGSFVIELLPDDGYELPDGSTRPIYNTPMLREYVRLTYHVYEGAVLYIEGSGDGVPVHYNDADQGAVRNCYCIATMAAAALIDPAIITSRINSNGNYSYTVTLYKPNGDPFPLTLGPSLDRGLDMAQPGDVSPSGAVEIWPVLIEHALSALRGSEGYPGGFPGSVSSTWQSLTGNTVAFSSAMPTRSSNQTWREFFDKFVEDVLSPTRDDGGAVVLESKPPQRDENDQVIDGTIFGDGDRTIVASHAYVVVDWDQVAGTIELYNPHGRNLTIQMHDLRFFAAYNMLTP